MLDEKSGIGFQVFMFWCLSAVVDAFAFSSLHVAWNPPI